MGNLPASRSMHIFNGEVFSVLPEWQDRLASIGLSANKDWTTLSSEQSVSGSYNTTSNFRFQLDDGTTIFFKRYVYHKIRLKHWSQPSKAAIEVAGFKELEQLGIPTLQAIAYGERRHFGLLQATFIVTKGITNVIEMDQYLARQWFVMSPAEKKSIQKHLQPVLIQQLQTAHNAGFYHWDLKLRNILLHNKADSLELIWIDCPRSRRKKCNDFTGIVTDLSAMARVGCRVLTRGQQIRFLLDYCNNDRQRARAIYKAIAIELIKRPPRPYWHLLSKDDPVYIHNIKHK